MCEEYTRSELEETRLELCVQEPVLEDDVRGPSAYGLKRRYPVARPEFVTNLASLFRVGNKLETCQAPLVQGANHPAALFQCGDHAPQIQFGATQVERSVICNQQSHWVRGPLPSWKCSCRQPNASASSIAHSHLASLVQRTALPIAAIAELV